MGTGDGKQYQAKVKSITASVLRDLGAVARGLVQWRLDAVS